MVKLLFKFHPNPSLISQHLSLSFQNRVLCLSVRGLKRYYKNAVMHKQQQQQQQRIQELSNPPVCFLFVALECLLRLL